MTSAARAPAVKTNRQMVQKSTRRRRNPRHQNLNSKEARSTKLKERSRTSVLEFGSWSFFGVGAWIWDLRGPARYGVAAAVGAGLKAGATDGAGLPKLKF